MDYYGFNIDDIGEDIFHELERVQDGRSGHTVAFKGETAHDATTRLVASLYDFFRSRMKPCDDHGQELSSSDIQEEQDKQRLRSLTDTEQEEP